LHKFAIEVIEMDEEIQYTIKTTHFGTNPDEVDIEEEVTKTTTRSMNKAEGNNFGEKTSDE